MRIKQKHIKDIFHNPVKGVPSPVQVEDMDVYNFLNAKTQQDSQDIFYPRASSLYKECIRMNVLGYILKKRITRYVTMKQRLTFAKGNAFHTWCQNTPDVFGDSRVGWWKCLACGKIRYFGKAPHSACNFCGASSDAAIYFEHCMLSDSGGFFLTGHPDLFLQYGTELFVAELKSINHDDFIKLRDPLVEHKWQILAYMKGLQYDKTLPVKVASKAGLVVYISKAEAKKDFPVKIFKVVPDSYITDQIDQRLALFSDGISDFPNALPPVNPKCLSAGWDSYISKMCPVINQCIQYHRGRA